MAMPNLPPIANAGTSQNVSIGFVGGAASKVVTLDGTGSLDPDFDALTFAWTLTKPIGSSAVLCCLVLHTLSPFLPPMLQAHTLRH